MTHAKLKPAPTTGGPSAPQVVVSLAGNEVTLSLHKAEAFGREVMQVVEQGKRLDAPEVKRPSLMGVLDDVRLQALNAMLHSRGYAFVINNVGLFAEDLARLVTRNPIDASILRKVETWIDERLRDG